MTSFGKEKTGAQSKAALGRLVAEALDGAWRASPPLPENTAQELDAIAEHLLRSGAGGLSWHKISHCGLRTSIGGQQLHQVYRLYSLQAELYKRDLKYAITLLRSFGADPVLVKGWAIARHYRDPGLRPCGDIDLCVLPEDFARAMEALKSSGNKALDVDLHCGFGKFYDRKTDELFARTQMVELEGIEIRILRPEDHLRFLCLHLLRHGAVRALWLCDIAVMLETLYKDFDWDMCLSGSLRQADWVACTIGLAHHLLGARVEDTPVADRVEKLPSWLVPAVFEEWGVPFRFPAQVANYLRHPLRRLRGLLMELPNHWPNPIEATMTFQGPFNEMPRLPFQVGHVFSRTTALLAELSKMAERAGSS